MSDYMELYLESQNEWELEEVEDEPSKSAMNHVSQVIEMHAKRNRH